MPPPRIVGGGKENGQPENRPIKIECHLPAEMLPGMWSPCFCWIPTPTVRLRQKFKNSSNERCAMVYKQSFSC